MLDFNAINGPFGKLYTAGLPFAGRVSVRHPSPETDTATIARMRSVPMFMVSGSHDTTSNPNAFNRPLWTAMAGNTNYPPSPGKRADLSTSGPLEDLISI